jgi:hypothetical protein
MSGVAQGPGPLGSRLPVDDRPGETPTQRFDRNWDDILQELRVTQTGTQILTGFLLALAFQPRFTQLDPYQATLYLILVGLAAASTVLALTPVALHRWLFRHRAKQEMVVIGNRVLRFTLAAVGLLVIGVVLFIFDVVVSRPAGIIAGGAALLIIATLWVLTPLIVGRMGRTSRPTRSSR